MKLLTLLAIVSLCSGCASTGGTSVTVRKATKYGDLVVSHASDGKTNVEWNW